MDEMGPVLSLVFGYWESSVVGPFYNRGRQGFQHKVLNRAQSNSLSEKCLQSGICIVHIISIKSLIFPLHCFDLGGWGLWCGVGGTKVKF